MEGNLPEFPGVNVFSWDPPLTNASCQYVRPMTHCVFDGFCFDELIGLEGRRGQGGRLQVMVRPVLANFPVGRRTFKFVFEQTFCTQGSGSPVDSYCRFSQSV